MFPHLNFWMKLNVFSIFAKNTAKSMRGKDITAISYANAGDLFQFLIFL